MAVTCAASSGRPYRTRLTGRLIRQTGARRKTPPGPRQFCGHQFSSIEQRFRRLQVRHVEAFGEGAVERRQQIARLALRALSRQQPRKTRSRAQFERTARLACATIAMASRRARSASGVVARLRQQDVAAQAKHLGVVEPVGLGCSSRRPRARAGRGPHRRSPASSSCSTISMAYIGPKAAPTGNCRVIIACDAGIEIAVLRRQPAALEFRIRQLPGKFVALGERIKLVRHHPAGIDVVHQSHVYVSRPC